MAEPAEYPPDPHVTRDLAPEILRDADGSTIVLPIVPALLDATGRLRAGVVATAMDIVAGEVAIRAVLPGWVATSSLSLQVGALPGAGELRVRPRVLRHGRTTLVSEVAIEHDGASVGVGTVAFAVLPPRDPSQDRVHWAEAPEPRATFAGPDSGFLAPLLDTLGVRFDPDDPSIARLAVGDYVRNTLGAMQGGVVAMLADAAADHHAAAAFGAPARVRGLELHYLKLGRHGPVRATARTVGELAAARLVRVELRDEGADDVLCTVANAVVERAPA